MTDNIIHHPSVNPLNSTANNISCLKSMLDNCKRAVVFTGAGISTESGIPDFRSPGGIWSKHKPVDFSDFISSAEARRDTWRLKLMFDKDIKQAEPIAATLLFRIWWIKASLAMSSPRMLMACINARGCPIKK